MGYYVMLQKILIQIVYIILFFLGCINVIVNIQNYIAPIHLLTKSNNIYRLAGKPRSCLMSSLGGNFHPMFGDKSEQSSSLSTYEANIKRGFKHRECKAYEGERKFTESCGILDTVNSPILNNQFFVGFIY